MAFPFDIWQCPLIAIAVNNFSDSLKFAGLNVLQVILHNLAIICKSCMNKFHIAQKGS